MDDRKIVELYWQRSERAIQETDRKFGAYCNAIAYNILEDRQDTEECVSDTWMRAWNSMPDKRPARLLPYLGRITRNLALNRAEARGRLKRGGGEAALALEELGDCVPARDSMEKELESRELTKALNAFLASQPELDRSLFICRYWFMASVPELAERFAFSQSKVSSRLHRTRQKLRNYLEEEGLI